MQPVTETRHRGGRLAAEKAEPKTQINTPLIEAPFCFISNLIFIIKRVPRLIFFDTGECRAASEINKCFLCAKKTFEIYMKGVIRFQEVLHIQLRINQIINCVPKLLISVEFSMLRHFFGTVGANAKTRHNQPITVNARYLFIIASTALRFHGFLRRKNHTT